MKWMVLNAFVFGLVSSVATAVVVRQIVTKSNVVDPVVVSAKPETANVLAAETGKGGPDFWLVEN